MTPDMIEQFVKSADGNGLVKAAASLTETERRRLSKSTATLYRTLAKAQWEGYAISANSLPTALFEAVQIWLGQEKTPDILDQLEVAGLAALAMCPISVTRKIDAQSRRTEHERQLIKVLTDRRPEWIDAWVEERLKGEWLTIHWTTLCSLIKAGVCAKPTSDGYVRLMVEAAYYPWSRRNDEPSVPLSEMLRSDPDLLADEIWRLFEVETNAFTFDWGEYAPNRPANYENWGTTLCKLAKTGDLDRQRLLDSCVAGLSSGFKNNVLSGYIKLHNQLQPTVAELNCRQRDYLDLLSNPVSHVVGCALKALKTLDKHQQLDDVAFVGAVGRVFDLKTKTQPRTALSLLKKVMQRRPDLAPAVARIAADGLAHEAVDIQEQFIDLLEHSFEATDNRVTHMLTLRCDEVAASQCPRLEALLARTSDRENRHPSAADRDELVRDLADLKEYISGLQNSWLRLAGVETLVAAIETDSFPPPLEFDLYDVLVLTGVNPITPIETLDELLETVAHAVEIVDSIDEVERILDGISRLCDQKPGDFDRWTALLVKRISNGPASGSSHGLITGWPPSLLLLLMAWLRPQPMLKRNRMESELTGPMTVIEARLKELADRVCRQQPAPLLAAPTHTHGWIDPTVLVDRVVALQAAEQPIPKHDLIQALLRMAPDHRQEAYQAAANIHSNVGRVIRWALGGDEQPQRHDRSEASLWLAAGRARSPKARIEKLAGFKLNRVGPDGIEPATYLWQATTKEVKNPWSSQVYRLSQLDLETRPAGPTGKKLADLPTVALHKKGHPWVIYQPHIPWMAHWIKQIWPQNADPFFAAGAVALASRIDDNSSSWYPNFVYVTPLLESDRPLSEMAILVLWLALVGKDADARGYAIDALAEAILDGRGHPDILGPVLIQLSQGGWLKLNRLAASLSEVAKLSAWHEFVIVRVLEEWLAARTDLPRDAHHILSLLLELLTSLDIGLAEKARISLKQKKGSSKSAKIARAILDRSGSDRSLKTTQALIEQLRNRIERAERWQHGRHWFQYESQY